ncbi:VOC family protein [Marmoricola endophyticus]|nr:VOC family protein [Marmoricola endophyticus]
MERTYPAGVTSWIDLEQPDVDAAQGFYSALLGWHWEERMPEGAPYRYAIASLDGADVAGLGGPGEGETGGTGGTGWQTYVAVDDAEAVAAAVTASGGRVLQPPTAAGPAGTAVVCADPDGVVFRLWQAGRRLGAQVSNVPGAWNFSHLHTDHPAVVSDFYAPLLGWRVVDQGWSTVIRVDGYGDHLAATVDPGIRERQASAPEGFADVIGGVQPLAEGEQPHWHVVVTVEDRDDAAQRARQLGAEVLRTDDEEWTRSAVIRDPQGAVLTLSQFTPPDTW